MELIDNNYSTIKPYCLNSKHDDLFIDMLDQIMSKTILIKFKDSQTHMINGKIIMFSEFIKLQCTNKKFNYRLDLPKVSLFEFLKVNDFLNIIDWRKDRYMFEIKQDELNGWYSANINEMERIKKLCEYLKLPHVGEFISSRGEYSQGEAVFATAVDIKSKGSYTASGFKPVDPTLAKSFNEAYPPKFGADDVSLKLPVELNVIKVNAANNIAYKGKFNIILKDNYFSKLIDGLISDSFWFVVCFFRSKNEVDKRLVDDLKKKTDIILKRISRNYFNMFITLCDDNCVVKKKDPVLNLFPDFISQCVYCALYLSYPKSRTAFDEEFKKRLISLFAYLYNGLNSQNTFSIDHWDLDLGTGNILESHETNKRSK
jgi:hypothetical protein